MWAGAGPPPLGGEAAAVETAAWASSGAEVGAGRERLAGLVVVVGWGWEVMEAWGWAAES